MPRSEGCGLSSLPPELLEIVCSELDQADLLRMAVVNRWISPIAIRRLYSSPHVDGYDGYASFDAAVSDRADLARLVTSVVWNDVRSLTSGLDDKRGSSTWWTKLPNCKHLVISLVQGNNRPLADILAFTSSAYPDIIELSIVRLSGMIAKEPIERLRKLQRLRLLDYQVDESQTSAVLQSFEPLQALEVTIPDNELFSHELDAICGIGQQLQHLRLEYGGTLGDILDLADSSTPLGARLPQLESLDLCVTYVEDTWITGTFPRLRYFSMQVQSPNMNEVLEVVRVLFAAVEEKSLPNLERLRFVTRFGDEQVKSDKCFVELQRWCDVNNIPLGYESVSDIYEDRALRLPMGWGA